MIIEELRAIKSGRSELRKFGITLGVILGLIGMFLLWRGRGGSDVLLVISLAFLALGFIVPLLLKPVYLLWMSLAVLLGWLMTRVILVMLFYLVVTPIGLVARLCGKDFLNRGFDRNAPSYWVARQEVTPDKERYENQF